MHNVLLATWHRSCEVNLERQKVWKKNQVLLVAEPTSIRIPVCWMINVMAAEGHLRSAVKVARESANGMLSPTQQPITNSVMNGKVRKAYR